MKTILDLHNIYYSYHTSHGETRALSNLSFSLAPGEFAAVVGPSGCGKSTLLSLICGLMKPQTGEILLNGEPVLGNSPQIGYMLQHDHLFEWRTIYRNILLGPEISHTLNKEIREKAKSMLTQYGLKSFIHARPSQLSGGMRQRAALIRTLLPEPELLLLDEPFAALDSYLKWKMEQQMMDLLKDIQKPALFVSHSRDEVYRLCDTVSCINQGKMEVIEPVKEFFKNPKTKTAALLSGCKNICSVELVKDLEPTETPMQDKSFGKLWAAEWGVAFDVSKEALTARTVGIRAHYLMQKKPKEGHITELTVGEYRILEDPFEWNISFRKDENCEWLQWKISKSDWNPSVGVPKVLYAREEDLLLLDRE